MTTDTKLTHFLPKDKDMDKEVLRQGKGPSKAYIPSKPSADIEVQLCSSVRILGDSLLCHLAEVSAALTSGELRGWS